jgi:hypothetical protein
MSARTRSTASTLRSAMYSQSSFEIGERIRMENVAAHPPDRRRSLFSRSFLNASSPSIDFTRPFLRSS